MHLHYTSPSSHALLYIIFMLFTKALTVVANDKNLNKASFKTVKTINHVHIFHPTPNNLHKPQASSPNTKHKRCAVGKEYNPSVNSNAESLNDVNEETGHKVLFLPMLRSWKIYSPSLVFLVLCHRNIVSSKPLCGPVKVGKQTGYIKLT